MKGSMMTFFAMNNSESVTSYFCEKKSDHIFSYDQQAVSGIAHFSEWKAHHIFSYNQQRVSNIAYFYELQFDHIFLMTNSK